MGPGPVRQLSNGFRAAWRALSVAGGTRRRGEGGLAPGRGLEPAWDSGWARRIVGCACKPLPPWARGARRSGGGGGGPTHRDPGNALLALEGHPDPRAGCESPEGAAETRAELS